VSFFATWIRYANVSPSRVRIISYRDFHADPARALMRAVVHAGLARTRAQCLAAIEKTWGLRGEVRFNRGEEGRGEQYFSVEQIERLERVLDGYSHLAPLKGELLALSRPALARAV
jgi:hypothetical protein